MGKDIGTRVKDSFDRSDKDTVCQYLDWLRDSYGSAASSVRRTVTVMLLLIAVFQLLQSAGAAELSLGPLKLTHASAVLYFIPPLVAYMYVEVVMSTAKIEDLGHVLIAVFKTWNENASANDMGVWILPFMPLYWSQGPEEDEQFSSPGYKLRKALAYAFFLLTIIGALGFQIYAFYRLFHIYHVDNVILWVNLVITAALVVAGVAYIFKAYWPYLSIGIRRLVSRH